MARFQTIHNFSGIDRDTPFLQRTPDMYWDARNIKLVNNGSNKAVSKHEGYEKVLKLPKVNEWYSASQERGNIAYTDPFTNTEYTFPIWLPNNDNGSIEHNDWNIVGTGDLNDKVVIIAVSSMGLTAVYLYTENERLELKYANYLNMQYNRRIEIITSFENLNIQKVYWVDGFNQLRHLNLMDPNLTTLEPVILDMVTPVIFSEPHVVELLSGGAFQPGRIQYCYTLYNQSGQETVISAASLLEDIVDPITHVGAGFDEETAESVPVSISVSIDDIDPKFSFIRVYGIHYSELSKAPAVRLIFDEKISNYSSFSFIDSGDSSIATITLDELIAKGGKKIIPQTFISKKNTLFLANYSRKVLNLDHDVFDARAYKYPYNAVVTHVKQEYSAPSSEDFVIETRQQAPPEEHNALNKEEGFMYQRNSQFNLSDTTEFVSGGYGATGKYVDFEIFADDPFVDLQEVENVEYPGLDPEKYKGKWNAEINSPHLPAAEDEYDEWYIVSVPGDQDINNDGTPITFNYRDAVVYDGTLYTRYAPVFSDSFIQKPTNETFKKGETYRFALEFSDQYGDKTDAKWICDFTMPYLQTDKVLRSKVTITDEGIHRLEEDGFVSYRLLMVERSTFDRTIVSQGIINPLTRQYYGEEPVSDYLPYTMLKDYTSTLGGRITVDFDQGVDLDATETIDDRPDRATKMHSELAAFYSPEVLFGEAIPAVLKIRTIGTSTLIENETFTHQQWSEDTIPTNEATDRWFYPGIVWEVDGRQGDDNVAHYMDNGLDRENDWEGMYWGFSRVYGQVNFNTDVINKQFPIDADVTMKNPPSVIDTGLSKNVDNKQVSALIEMKHWTGGGYGGLDGRRGLQTEFTSFLTLAFDSNTWHKKSVGDLPFSKFAMIPPDTTRKIPIAELIQDLPNQYNGPNYATRQRNEYIPISKTTSLIDNNTIGFGDVFLNQFMFQRNTSYPLVKQNDMYFHDEWVSVLLETNLNLITRFDDMSDGDFYAAYDSDQFALHPDSPGGFPVVNNLEENHRYNSVYHQPNTTFKNYAKPVTIRDVETFPATVIASDTKISNENVDSWLAFQSVNQITVDSTYGEIRALRKKNDEAMFFQRKGIGHLSILPRVQTVATDGVSLQLGQGSVLQDYRYITTTSGCIHKWSIVNDKEVMFYFDYDNRVISMLSTPENELTTATGLNKFFWDYIDRNPALAEQLNETDVGLVAHYDNRSENVYFTFIPDEYDINFTISFNTLLKKFISFHDFKPSMYHVYRGKMFMIDKDIINAIEYNKFDTPDKDYPLSITLLNTDKAMFIKRYDNIEIDSNVNFDRMRFWNSYQDSGTLPFKASNSVLRKRLVVPRKQNSMQRLKDDHLYMKFDYDKLEPLSFEFLVSIYNIAKTTYVQ